MPSEPEKAQSSSKVKRHLCPVLTWPLFFPLSSIFFFFFFFNFSYPSFLILFFMLPLLSIFSTLEAFSLPTLIIPTPTPQDRCIYRPSLLLLHTSNALLSPVLSNCFSFLLPLLVSTFYAWIMRWWYIDVFNTWMYVGWLFIPRRRDSAIISNF